MKKIACLCVAICLCFLCGCSHPYYVSETKTKFGLSPLVDELPKGVDAPSDVKMVFSTFVEKYQLLDGYVQDFSDPALLTNNELVFAGFFMAGVESSNVTQDAEGKHYIISYQALVNQLDNTYNIAKFDSLYLSSYYSSDKDAFIVPIDAFPKTEQAMGVITDCNLQNGEMSIKADFYSPILVNVLEGKYELYKTETAGYLLKRVNGAYVLCRTVVYFKLTGIDMGATSINSKTTSGAIK